MIKVIGMELRFFIRLVRFVKKGNVIVMKKIIRIYIDLENNFI